MNLNFLANKEANQKNAINHDILVNLEDINFVVENKKILTNISLNVMRGEIITIIGPNGSGKTSLIKIIAGLVLPSSGKKHVDKKLVIGYMPQKINIDITLPITVRRFLRLNGKKWHLRSLKETEKIAENLGIAHLLKQQIHQLSGGEMQKVMLIRALLLNPDLLILDEPTQGMDIHNQNEFYQLIARLRDKLHCGILLVSHDLHMVMAATNRVICINHHICCQGRPSEISSNPEFLALFNKNNETNIKFYEHKHDHEHGL